MSFIPDTIAFKTRYLELRRTGEDVDIPYTDIGIVRYQTGASFVVLWLKSGTRFSIKPDNYTGGIAKFLVDLRRKLR